MRRGQIIVLALVLLIVGVVVVWRLIFPTYAYRYQMTVNVESGGNRYSGASVIEVRLKRQFQFLSGVPRVATEVSGEAIFVDLGGGRNVIALLAAGQDINYPKNVVPKHFNLSYSDKDLSRFPRLEGQWRLEGADLPTFLTFANLSDPSTSRVIPAGDLAEEFGLGTRLLSVTVEMTKASVTVGIESRLPWWNMPLPWVKSDASGIGFDTRREGFRWYKDMFKRES